MELAKRWAQYAFNVATLFVLGQQSENDRKELTKACECIIKGLGCWRLYFPGTNYFKACQVNLSFYEFPSTCNLGQFIVWCCYFLLQ